MSVASSNPQTEPVASETISRALVDATSLASRILKMRDKLVGAPKSDVMSSGERLTFAGREGRLNAMADQAMRASDSIEGAHNVITQLERQLGINDIDTPKGANQVFGGGGGISGAAFGQMVGVPRAA